MTDRQPTLWKPAFTCPHCRAYAQQEWMDLRGTGRKTPPVSAPPGQLQALLDMSGEGLSEADKMKRLQANIQLSLISMMKPRIAASVPSTGGGATISGLLLSICLPCSGISIWVGNRIIFPMSAPDVPEPNSDMPSGVRGDYEEASLVLGTSPRAAAALLRLAIQKLCQHVLGRKGDVNEMIGVLVRERGLSPTIQKALDVVRVVGNEAVHPGVIDLKDDVATASAMFNLTNLITEAMITTPRHVEEMYAALPAGKREAIAKRDASKPASTRKP